MTKVHLLDRLPLPPIKPVLISPEHAAVVRPLVGKPKICKTAASLDGGGDKNRETTHDTPKTSKTIDAQVNAEKITNVGRGKCETGYHGVMIC